MVDINVRLSDLQLQTLLIIIGSLSVKKKLISFDTGNNAAVFFYIDKMLLVLQLL